jgi:agmatine deiminase
VSRARRGRRSGAWLAAGLAALVLTLTGCAAARRAESPGPEFRFPPDWAPHEAMWLGWSTTPRQQPVQVEMIRAMAPHVRIRLMVTSEATRAQAAAALGAAGLDPGRVEFVLHEDANFWIRDAGPRFLTDGRRLALVELGWNTYGYPQELLVGLPELRRQGPVSRALARRLGVSLFSTRVVGEGGGLELSSEVILTYKSTAVQRNPDLPLEEIEREYLRVHGKKKVVWLDRSPLSDRVFSGPKLRNYFGWGANGHIDEYARFVDDSTVVIGQIDPADAEADPISRVDAEILRENLAQLRAAVNVDGRPFRIVTVPMPALHHRITSTRLTEAHKRADFLDAWYRDFKVGDEIHWVPAISYLNFVITNGVVLVPAYWRPGLPERERAKDIEVRDTLQRLLPDRRVVQIDPYEVNRIGGGMHCITQQQPRVR